MSNAILLISCPDQKGITAAVTSFVADHNGNILHADQHIDDQTNTFFMRLEWDMTGFELQRRNISKAFEEIAKPFKMAWELNTTDERPRAAIFVSKHLHCLYDLLLRHQAGQLACEIPLIVSNHPDARATAQQFGIEFYDMPVLKENKHDQERHQLGLLKRHTIDFVVLARYHQVLTRQFIEQYPNKIINIHHSFLPAFVGQKPYEQAYRKGVKIIGATSHYAAEDLDQGPIIEQDTVRISHRDVIADLIRKGEDLEKVVLSRAVRWHIERKILAYGNKTVIFD